MNWPLEYDHQTTCNIILIQSNAIHYFLMDCIGGMFYRYRIGGIFRGVKIS